METRSDAFGMGRCLRQPKGSVKMSKISPSTWTIAKVTGGIFLLMVVVRVSLNFLPVLGKARVMRYGIENGQACLARNMATMIARDITKGHYTNSDVVNYAGRPTEIIYDIKYKYAKESKNYESIENLSNNSGRLSRKSSFCYRFSFDGCAPVMTFASGNDLFFCFDENGNVNSSRFQHWED